MKILHPCGSLDSDLRGFNLIIIEVNETAKPQTYIQPVFIHDENPKLISLWDRVRNEKIQMLRIIKARIK